MAKVYAWCKFEMKCVRLSRFMQRCQTINQLNVSEKDHVINHEAEKGQQLKPFLLLRTFSYYIQHLVYLPIFENELDIREL